MRYLYWVKCSNENAHMKGHEHLFLILKMRNFYAQYLGICS